MRARLERVRRLTTVIALASLAACRGPRDPVDLLRAGDRLVEARAASLDKAGVLQGFGKPLRINDVVRRTLPAGPPGRLRVPARRAQGRTSRVFLRGRTRVPGPAGRRVRGQGSKEWTRGRALLEARGPALPSGAAVLGDGGDRPRAVRRTRGRVDSRNAGLRPRRRSGAGRVGHTRGHGRAARRAPRRDLPRGHAARGPHRRVRVRAGHHAAPRRLRPRRGRLRAGGGPRLLDEAVRGLDLHLAPPGPAPGRAASGSPRSRRSSRSPRCSRPRATPRAPRSRTRSSTARSRASTAASTSSRASTARATGRASSWGRTGVVDAALSWLEARRGFPTFLYVHTMDPHVPYAPPPPFDRKYEPHPTEGHPAQDPRSDYKEPLDRERMIAQYDGDIAYGDQEFGSLPARAPATAASTRGRRSSSRPTTARSSWTTGSGCTAGASSTSSSAFPWWSSCRGSARRGRRVSQQVQAVDILPTVLESQWLPVPGAARHRRTPPPARARGTGGASCPPSPRSATGASWPTACARRRDKYIHRFGPETDELYFDLVKDPEGADEHPGGQPARVRLLKGQAEAAMTPNPFRYVGEGRRLLRVRARPRYRRLARGRRGDGPRAERAAQLRGRTGGKPRDTRCARDRKQPREVAFALRPRGARP